MQKLENYMMKMENKNSNMKYYIAGGVAVVLVVVLILVLTNKSKEGYDQNKYSEHHAMTIKNSAPGWKLDTCMSYSSCDPPQNMGLKACCGQHLYTENKKPPFYYCEHDLNNCLRNSYTKKVAWGKEKCINDSNSYNDTNPYPTYYAKLLYLSDCMNRLPNA